jgi:hypothetical protein
VVGAGQDCEEDDIVDPSETEASLSFGWQGPGLLGTGFEEFADTVGGGACLNFCSTKCLRSFLNDCVDHLEDLIKEAKSEHEAAQDDESNGDGSPHAG